MRLDQAQLSEWWGEDQLEEAKSAHWVLMGDFPKTLSS